MPVMRVTSYEKGPRGTAVLKKLKNKIVVTLDKTGETIEFKRDEEHIGCPIPKSGAVYVQVSKEKDYLMAVRPVKGTFPVNIQRFAASKDKEPAPRHYEGIGRKKNGETFPYSYEAFTVLLEIKRGEWKGTILPAFLHYKFGDAGDGETAAIYGTGKYSELLYSFLELAGMDMENDTIPLSENVLPFLEKLFVDRNEEFLTIVDAGYIQAFAPPM